MTKRVIPWVLAIATLSVLLIGGRVYRTTEAWGEKVAGVAEQNRKDAQRPAAKVAPPTLAVHKLLIATAYSPREACPGGTAVGCKTASGTQVRDGIVAMNCVRFGTKVGIADREYVVEDRMPEWAGCGRVDVYHDSWDAAIRFGVQHVQATIAAPAV